MCFVCYSVLGSNNSKKQKWLIVLLNNIAFNKSLVAE